MNARTLLRALALLIAAAGIVDPAIPGQRRTRPVVAVLAGANSADGTVAERAVRVLADGFTVVRGPFPAAAATVVVSDRLPRAQNELAGPVFLIQPGAPATQPRIVAVSAPARASLTGRVPVHVTARSPGPAGRAVEFSLAAGPLLLDQTTADLTRDGRADAILTFVPAAAGPVALRVTARIVESAASASGSTGSVSAETSEGDTGAQSVSAEIRERATSGGSGTAVEASATPTGDESVSAEIRERATGGVVRDRAGPAPGGPRVRAETSRGVVRSAEGSSYRRVSAETTQGAMLAAGFAPFRRVSAETSQGAMLAAGFAPFRNVSAGTSQPPIEAQSVSAETSGRDGTARAELVVDVVDEPWEVLFWEPRPGWSATFIRRAARVDARFRVTSRTITSRDVSTSTGRPPASLADPAALEAYDAIVVGAPDALGARDAAGLAAYMRERGGSVILLLDAGTPPVGGLAQVARWSSAVGERTSLTLDGRELVGSEFAWPATLPAGATVLAAASAGGGAARPVIWESAMGEGRLLVSGAVDAWRFRDPETSDFEALWLDLLARAAAATPPPIRLALGPATVQPGAITEIQVQVRPSPGSRQGGASEGADNEVSIALDASFIDEAGGETVIRLWPESEPGSFRGAVRAPARAGRYTVRVRSGERQAEATLVVDTSAAPPPADEAELLPAFAGAHGGAVVPASEVAALPRLLDAAITPAEQPVILRPMRSAWWILPFALALAAEWWLRRRRGLA